MELLITRLVCRIATIYFNLYFVLFHNKLSLSSPPSLLPFTHTHTHTAQLTITQGRITFIPDFNLETYPVVGIATVELAMGRDTSSRPSYFFDCVTNRNNGSGLRWTRATTNHRFAVSAIPDGTYGVRMDAGGFDYEDLDIYTCSDQNSADVVTLNITDCEFLLI